jgi:hypothetical protein
MQRRRDVVFIYTTRTFSRLQTEYRWCYLLSFNTFQLAACHEGKWNSILGLVASNVKIDSGIYDCQLCSLSTGILRAPESYSRSVYSECQNSDKATYRIFCSSAIKYPNRSFSKSCPAKDESLDVINTHPQQLTHNKAPPDHKAASGTNRLP